MLIVKPKNYLCHDGVILPTMAFTMGRKSLPELAHEAIQALWQRRAFSQRAFAKAIQRPPSIANRMIKGTQPITLRALEAAGQLAGVNPVELLIDPELELKAINPQEAQMLRYFRSWPVSTREALLSFASFFADEDPATHDERRAHEQIRRLGEGKKRLVYAYLTFLTEGEMPPDIRKGLGLPEIDAPPETPRGKPSRKKTPRDRA